MNDLKDEDEKRMFDKYIKPYTGILSRIKTKLLVRYRRKRIRTVDDFDFLSSSLVVKLFAILMIILVIQILGTLIYDVYVWFFPQAPPGGIAPMKNVLACGISLGRQRS